MTRYSEKFSAIHHEYHNGKMKKLSIGTEGLFDFFKKKKKEEEKPKEKEKSIEDFVNLFNEEFSVIEKKISESDKTEWVIDSRFIGKVKTPQELINSVKGHVTFLKEMEGAMDLVIKGINECNNFTRTWTKSPEDDDTNDKSVEKIAKYRVEPKHFRSLDIVGKAEGFVGLGDKVRSFTFVLNVIESPHGVDYSNVPVMTGSFTFNKDSEEKITLDKAQFTSFLKELKTVNSILFTLNKDYIYYKTSKFDQVIKTADDLYDKYSEIHENEPLLDEAYGVAENYYQGTYTELCQEVVEGYVKYIHSFLSAESKA